METIRKEGDKLIITKTIETVEEINAKEIESEIFSLQQQIKNYNSVIDQLQDELDKKQAYLTTHFGK